MPKKDEPITLNMCLQEQWEDVAYLIRLIDGHDDWCEFDKTKAEKFLKLKEKYLTGGR